MTVGQLVVRRRNSELISRRMQVGVSAEEQRPPPRLVDRRDHAVEWIDREVGTAVVRCYGSHFMRSKN